MPPSVPEDRPHSDLTRSILESAMRVQSALGVGLYEKPYKVCLAHALRQKGHRVLMRTISALRSSVMTGFIPRPGASCSMPGHPATRNRSLQRRTVL